MAYQMPDPGSPSSAATTPRGEGLPDLEGDSVDNACRAPSPDQIFDHQQQKLVLLLKQALRWLGTVIFIGFIIATLKIYEAKGNFPADQKVTFNTILTALSLGLGLNIFVSCNLTEAEAYTHRKIHGSSYHRKHSKSRRKSYDGES